LSKTRCNGRIIEGVVVFNGGLTYMDNDKFNYGNIEDRSAGHMTLEDIGAQYITSGHTQGSYTVEDYRALPDEERVELIDGYFFYMEAPTVIHQRIAAEVFFQINYYIKAKKGKCVPLIAPVDVQLDCDEHTMVQPDVLIICHDERMTPKCIYGSPDFIMEVISPSTKRKDCLKKLYKYENAGVREYWILDPYDKKVLVYFFEDGIYPVIHGLDEPIPVNIYGGDLVIDLSDISRWIQESRI
jgi:Uma2 family endonuclease